MLKNCRREWENGKKGMPAKINNEVITSKGSAAYKANKGLDANGDGMITKSELANRVMKHRVNESVFLA